MMIHTRKNRRQNQKELKVLERNRKEKAAELKKVQKTVGKKNFSASVHESNNNNISTGATSLKEFFGISGVYFLFSGTKLVYIGESACILTRISQHIGTKTFDSFKYEIVIGETERKIREKHLIDQHRPLLNLVHNRSVALC